MPKDDVPSNPIPRSASVDDAAAAAQQMKQTPTVDPALNPKTHEVYSFEVNDVIGADGKLVPGSGKFKNKILTIQQRIDVGLTASFIVNNLPWASLDESTQNLVMTTAHLKHSLVETPKGFSLSDSKSTKLIFAVYEEVADHEATFRRPPPPPKPSEG